MDIDSLLLQCASCLSSAVAILSDVLSCTCIGKPLANSEQSSPGGSTPIPASVVQQKLQQQQRHLYGVTHEKPSEQEGQERIQNENIVDVSSGGGVSFNRGGGQQPLERQSSLLPGGEGDDDTDSDDDSFGFFELSNFPGPSDQCTLQSQRPVLQGDQEREEGSAAGSETHIVKASCFSRPDTRSVSADYIQRAIADLPEKPPAEIISVVGVQNSKAANREEEGQLGRKEQQSANNEEPEEQARPQLEQQLFWKSNQNFSDQQGQSQDELQQQSLQGYGEWRADYCLSPCSRISLPWNTREWRDSLERAEFVELYLVPKVRFSPEQASAPLFERKDRHRAENKTICEPDGCASALPQAPISSTCTCFHDRCITMLPSVPSYV